MKFQRGSILIPVYNEEAGIGSLFESLNNVLSKHPSLRWELVLVNDGSSDNSVGEIERCSAKLPDYVEVRVVNFARNFGQQPALQAGLREVTGDFVFTIDADLQDPPELLTDFMVQAEEGYDVVYGVRQNRKEGPLKKVAYWSFYRLFAIVSEYPIPLDSGDFSLVTRPVIDAMNRIDERDAFLRGLRGWVGFKQIGLPYDRPARAIGEEKYTFRKLLKLAFSALYGFSWLPLRAAAFLGVGAVGASSLYFVWIVLRKLMGVDMPSGWPSILAVLILLGGVQLITIGILGEYIGRIHRQILPRPSYIVAQTQVFDSKGSPSLSSSEPREN